MEENVIQINDGITININVSVKNVMYVEKIMFGILLHDSCENGRYSASFMDDSGIMCDRIIESYDKETTYFNEQKATCKIKNFYILLAFLLITIALLIAVSIYCYLIKYQGKQKHLLPFHITNNKLKEIVY